MRKKVNQENEEVANETAVEIANETALPVEENKEIAVEVANETAVEVANETAVEVAVENQTETSTPSDMTENQIKEALIAFAESLEDEKEEQKPEEKPIEKPTVFVRWNYQESMQAEYQQEKEKKKKGVLSYFLYFMIVVLVAVGTMFLTLALTDSFGTNNNVDEPAVAVANKVLPSTVYIKCNTADGTYTGSGFFVTADGYLITNAHVVDNAISITVTMYDGTEYSATVIGAAELEDIALLKINATVTPVTLGDSSALQIGQIAIALGNPASDEGCFSTTQGIISYLNRPVEEEGVGCIANVYMIQMDTTVNPGNSGGPLCDKNGNVIGVVSRKMVNSNLGNYYEGMGLAIPINGAMEIAEQLKNGTYVEGNNSITKIRPTIGISAGAVKVGDAISKTETAKYDGIYVSAISSGSDAEGKLAVGDIIVKIDGATVTTMAQVQEILFKHQAGDLIIVSFYRGDTLMTVSVELGKASK